MKNYPKSEYVEDSKFKIQVMPGPARRQGNVDRPLLSQPAELHRRDQPVPQRAASITRLRGTRRRRSIGWSRPIMGLGITDEAETAAAVLGHNFPDSEWYKDAYQSAEEQRPVAAGELGTPGCPRSTTRSFRPERSARAHARATFDPRHRADRSVGSRISARPDDPHRRDRRGQVDPARRAVARARRARRRRRWSATASRRAR